VATRALGRIRRGGGDTVNTNTIEKRGYQSALSACPAPAAAFVAAASACARPRADVSGYRLALGATAAFQGTGLPVAVRFVDAQRITDVRTMLVQLDPGDTARRPPA
jgi:hypothetical protein